LIAFFGHFILSSIFGHFIVLLPHDPLTMSTPNKPKFQVRDRVQDRETGVLGTVVLLSMTIRCGGGCCWKAAINSFRVLTVIAAA
jgi:hypothetical protein